MDNTIIGQMNSDEFENLIEGFIEHRSGEDDRLPAQTFFELLAERQASQPPLEIHISWLETGPVVTAPPDAPLVVEGRHIRFDDGRELILNFDLNSWWLAECFPLDKDLRAFLDVLVHSLGQFAPHRHA